MSELKGLLVYSNSLTGTIPEFLGDMESLDAVIISDNDISGTIPTELAKLNNLLWLGLEYMELDGTIPSALAQLPSLQNLQLSKFVWCILLKNRYWFFLLYRIALTILISQHTTRQQ